MKIQKLPSSSSVKTAAQTPKAPTSSLDRALAAALGEEKVAGDQSEVEVAAPSAMAQGNVVASLSKLAEDVAISNFDRQVAQVDKLGTVLADAFVRRIGDWEAGGAKLASARGDDAALTHEELAMVHDYRTNPAVFVQKVAAMVEGADAPLTEKQAQEIYAESARDATRMIHKVAMDHFAEGYRAIDELLAAG